MNELSEAEPQLVSRFSRRAIFNSALRSVVWLLVLVGGFLIVIPEFKNILEEFGVELPVLSQFAISLSDKANKFSFAFVSLVILVLMIAELGLLSIPRGAIRRNLNKLSWLVLLIAIILFAVTVGIPLISNVAGLSA